MSQAPYTTSMRALGRTQATVFPIGLGAMPLSIQGRPDERQGIEVVLAALDAGVGLIDTADVYCLDDGDLGHNERLIRKALDLRGAWDSVIVATKGGLRRPKGEWTTDGSPRHLREACEASLRALNTSSIFLYQLHAPDEEIPLEDSVGELARLQSEGKIRHIGLSNVNEEELDAALAVCRIETIQNRCNPFQQTDIRNGLIQKCEKLQIGYLAYSPVGGGNGHRLLAQDPVLNELSAKYQATPYSITLAWLLAKGGNVIPIPGASRVSSIQGSVNAVNLKLEATDLEKIDRLSPF